MIFELPDNFGNSVGFDGYRWLAVQHPEQPSFQLGLFKPGPPIHDAATAQTLYEIVAKGAMRPLVLMVDDCRATYERLSGRNRWGQYWMEINTR